MPIKPIEIPPGTQFGLLTVLSTSQPVAPGAPYKVRCECACGVVKDYNKGNLLKGGTNSCGCLKSRLTSARMTKHGHSTDGAGKRSPTYSSWHSMLDRVNRPRKHDKKNYAHVDMDPRWNDFATFLADMGERPSGDYSIDRIDNEKGYWPSNCRWATRLEQVLNRRPLKFSPEGLENIRQATIARHAANRAAKQVSSQERT